MSTDIELDYTYQRLTGTGHALCHWLGYRFEERYGFRPEAGESWVGWAEGSRLTTSIRHTGWITDLYQTDSKVWATEASGMIFVNPSLGLGEPWQQAARLEGVLSGVWGLADDDVFVWGLHNRAPIAYHFDGSQWRRIETPGHIVAVHGAAPDLVYAVGQRGLLARWNGRTAFEALEPLGASTISDVHVVSADEMVACGGYVTPGELWSGSTAGWHKVLEHDRQLHCVAKWKDRVWVGADNGLFELVDGTLRSVRPQARPVRFDARGELMITEPEFLTHSLDGENFRMLNLEIFQRITAHREPTW